MTEYQAKEQAGFYALMKIYQMRLDSKPFTYEMYEAFIEECMEYLSDSIENESR